MKPKMKIVRKKKKETKQKRKRYDEDNLKRALDAVQEGMSKKLAAKRFQVPRSTIQFRINNHDKVNPRPGPPTVLTQEEEKHLVNWIIESGRKGFPKRKEDLQHSVAKFLQESNRQNPFKNNKPGEKWLKLFLQRHPEVTFRTPEAVTAASSVVSENDIRKWFDGIERYLEENQRFEILSDPSRVLNGDETNFLLCPKTGTVLAAKGEKNVYEVDQGQAKTAITVMFTFAANGDTTPPMIIFPYKRLPSEIAAKVPSDWGIGLSENGWMKADLFHDYIENVLHPHLVKEGTVFPVILFVDGHKTHLTLQVSELCSKLKFVLVALYPNSTRILQPADVSAFYPLKCSWKKSVLNWRRENPSQALTKLEFVPILKEAIDKSVSPDTVKNGFRACGLYPWDANALDYSKCLGNSKTSQDLVNSAALAKNTNRHTESPVITKENFMTIIGSDTIKSLEESENLTECDILLKKLWNCFRNFNAPVDQTEISLSTAGPDTTENQAKKITDIQDKILNADVKDSTQTLEIQDTSELLSEIPEWKTYLDQSGVVNMNDINIEDLDVVIADDDDDDDETPCAVSIAHEVVIHEYNNNDCEPESIKSTCDDNISNKALKKVGNSLDPVISFRNQHDFNEITMMPEKEDQSLIKHQVEKVSENKNPLLIKHKVKTPLKPDLKPVQLQDILVLPKTPKRKGTKDTEKVTFVLTSAEWQSKENAKKRAKEQKEEGIRKRKEEREQKKLNAKPKQPKTKQPQIKITNIPKIKQEKQTDKEKLSEIRKVLFSEEFYKCSASTATLQVKKTANVKNHDTTSKLNAKDTAKMKDDDTDTRIGNSSTARRKYYTESEIEKMLTED